VAGRSNAAWISFLLAGGEFEGMALTAIVLFGWPLPSFFTFQELALPAAYVVGAAAAGVMFLVSRRRERAGAAAWTEPLDLATLRLRIASPERVAAAPQLPVTKTRQLLDEMSQHRAARASGVAGTSRRPL
jgi:hypothetical protein